MYISQLTMVNYRNFANTTLLFTKGVNTIIGENGSGKTNLFRAIRLLLDNNMVRSVSRLDESDFHRGLGDWRGHWIIISLEFREIGPDEATQALFVHSTGVVSTDTVDRATYNLIFRPKKYIRQELAKLEDDDTEGLATIRQAITIADYETVFTGRSGADFSSEALYKEIVGDFENCVFGEELDDPRLGSRIPQILSLTDEVSFTFIQALRDVVSEFHNNRANPLLTLLKSKGGDIDPDTLAPIVTKVQDLNSSIQELEDVQTVRRDIRNTIKDAVGETYSPTSLSIKSDLPDDADRLFKALRLFIGESEEGYEGAIHELSLGGANLIFLTLKLLEFQYQRTRKPIANFLLIEEPEAHIHTHIQKTLFDRIAYEDTQIIYSTHSPQISEVCNVESVNILRRSGSACEADQPSSGLLPQQIRNVQRYLDAVRSNLLFAKSVVLVEGDAEEILIPILFKKVLGLSLDELGISMINVRSTGFENVAALFHDQRIKKRCSIITDLDAAFIDTSPIAGETRDTAEYKEKCLRSQTKGAERKTILEEFVAGNTWLSTYYAEHTFEVDFVAAGNGAAVAALVDQVYTRQTAIDTAKAELVSSDKAVFGKRVLTMAENQGKGWFAILLGQHVDHTTVIPTYILDAIFFARQSLSVEIFFNIYTYRIKRALKDGKISLTQADEAREYLAAFRNGDRQLQDLKTEMARLLPGDQVHTILSSIS